MAHDLQQRKLCVHGLMVVGCATQAYLVEDLVVLLTFSPCRRVCTGQMDPHLRAAEPPAGLLGRL